MFEYFVETLTNFPSFLQVLYFLVGRCIYQSNFSRWPIAPKFPVSLKSCSKSLDFKHFLNIFKYFFHARLNTLLKLWPISPSFLQVLYFLVGRCLYQSNFSRWPIAFSPLESVLKTNLHPVFYSSMGTINMAPYTAIFGELSANEKTALYLLPFILASWFGYSCDHGHYGCYIL